jgi:hypothetical protein
MIARRHHLVDASVARIGSAERLAALGFAADYLNEDYLRKGNLERGRPGPAAG